MAYAVKRQVTVTTNADGVGTAYLGPFNGRVLDVLYGKVSFASGVDFTITAEDTGRIIWAESDVDESKNVAPRQPVHGTDGVGAFYADSGEPVLDHITLAEERVKVAIASGGNAKSGTFTIIVG